MPQYTATVNIRVGGADRAKNSTFELDAETARPLVEKGYLTEVQGAGESTGPLASSDQAGQEQVQTAPTAPSQPAPNGFPIPPAQPTPDQIQRGLDSIE